MRPNNLPADPAPGLGTSPLSHPCRWSMGYLPRLWAPRAGGAVAGLCLRPLPGLYCWERSAPGGGWITTAPQARPALWVPRCKTGSRPQPHRFQGSPTRALPGLYVNRKVRNSDRQPNPLAHLADKLFGFHRSACIDQQGPGPFIRIGRIPMTQLPLQNGQSGLRGIPSR